MVCTGKESSFKKQLGNIYYITKLSFLSLQIPTFYFWKRSELRTTVCIINTINSVAGSHVHLLQFCVFLVYCSSNPPEQLRFLFTVNVIKKGLFLIHLFTVNLTKITISHAADLPVW